MPGRQTGDNKFGLTPFIVGPVLGDGCNYDTIQSAIDDCFAAGGGVVGIRPGTYTENLTLRNNVELFGFDVDGRLPSLLSHVAIIGNHTFAVAGGFAAQLSQYINFSAVAGDVFTISATGGGQAILALKFCGCEAFTVAGQRIAAMNADGASACQFSTDNTNVNSSGSCFESLGAGSHAAFLSLGNANSQSADVFTHSSGSGSLTLEYLGANGALYVFNGVAANGNFTSHFSELSSSLETVLFPAGNGQAQVFHSTVGSSAPSGFWVDGTGGQVDYANVIFNGSANAVGPLVTEQKTNWQPYGEAGAAPGAGVPRGTAAYNSADFSVTDGFVSVAGSVTGPITQLNGDTGSATPVAGIVQILGGPGVTTNGAGNAITISSVDWIDSAVGGLLNVDQGLFDVGPNTYTLPAAPLQGEQVRFYSINAPSVINANVGQTIQLGSQTSSVGGAITGTATGDCLVLVYNAGTTRWCAESAIGNWTLS